VDIGKTLATLRIYLTGRISIEGTQLVEERDLPGRQGRLAFAFLVGERHRPVRREQLISVVWPDSPPPELDAALSAILSKLRTALRKAGRSTSCSIEVRLGTVQIRLPSDTWIDIEGATNSVDEAEGSLRAGVIERAWSHANVVVSIARRPFLADEDAPWIENRRAKLRSLLVRGLHALSIISARNNEPALAVQYAAEMIEIDPFRETGYRHLMRLHAEMGNRAEALRIFGKCRELLRDELGADPSQETEAMFMEILRAGQ
jgi:DNA-binding SARP family transcriptional activator